MNAPLTKKRVGSMKASPIAQMERIKSVEIGNEKAKILMAKPDLLCLRQEITDKHYRTPAFNSFNVAKAFRGDPRTLRLEFRYRF